MRRFVIAAAAPLAFCLPSLLFPLTAGAHALVGRPLQSPSPVALEFMYSSGGGPAYEKVEVFSPDDRKVEYQNGRADQAGRFAFVPDRPGEWLVVLADGMGHRAEVSVPVSAADLAGSLDAAPKPALSAAGSGPEGGVTPLRIVLGLSLILNLFAMLTWFRRRKAG